MRCRAVVVRTLIAIALLSAAPRARASEPETASARPADEAPGTSALDSLLAAPALDLPLLERATLQRNPSLGAIRSAWHAAEASADQAGAIEDPTIDFSTAPRSWNSDAVDAAYMVEISQHFPIFGQRGLRGQAARAEARAMGADYGAARLDLVREVRRDYLDYYLVTRGLAVNAELKALLTQFRRTAVAKYAAGTVGMDDALQAEVELGMLDHAEIALMRGRRLLAARINALLRREPAGTLPDPPAEVHVVPAPARADSVRIAALEGRPELEGWAAQREAREATLKLAGRQRLPEFTFMARYDRFMNESEWRPQIGVGLNLPIVFGRIGAAEREARAGLEQVAYRRQAAENQIGYEVESAFAQVQESEHEVHIMEDRVLPATERALAAIRASYENNRADFSSLLNAERDAARARLGLHEARVRYLQALADLDRAAGRPILEDAAEVGR